MKINYNLPEGLQFDHNFIHFASEELCNQFIILLNQSNINIIHKCCSGFGCGILNADMENAETIKDSLMNSNICIPIITNLISSETNDICNVCLDDTNTKTKCNHQLCNGCYNKLYQKICPCCRQSL